MSILQQRYTKATFHPRLDPAAVSVLAVGGLLSWLLATGINPPQFWLMSRPEPGRPSSIERLCGESFRPSARPAGLVSSLMHGAEAPLRGMNPVRWLTRVRGGILFTNRGIAGLLGILFAF